LLAHKGRVLDFRFTHIS